MNTYKYEKLMDWLIRGYSVPMEIASSNGTERIGFIRVPQIVRGKRFDLLYASHVYDGNTAFNRHISLEFCGLYAHETHKVYGAAYTLTWFLEIKGDEESPFLDIEDESVEFAKQVCAAVEAKLQNDPRNLKIKSVQNYTYKNHLEYMRQYGAAEDARRMYLDGEANDPIVYKCDFRQDDGSWPDDELMAYLAEPKAFVEEYVEKYISENQEHILTQFKRNDLVRDALKELLADKENYVHQVKPVRDAMLTFPMAKTVNVTILKSGKEFTFKTEADALRREVKTGYSTLYMTAPDRQKYEELFGKYKDYYPQEIQKITYGKNIVFERA